MYQNRKWDCVHYDKCLAKAAKKDWKHTFCRTCNKYEKIEHILHAGTGEKNLLLAIFQPDKWRQYYHKSEAYYRNLK